MKRLIQILVTVSAFLVVSTRAGAQAVVIDPSQIAASAINVADQIDYAIDQIGELANLGDKLKGVKEYVDDVFGEDGIGGKAIGMMEDLGTLQRLTEAFNMSIQSFEQYAAYIKETEKYGISEANTLLMYLNSAKKDATMAVDVAKKILGTLGLTKKEKKDELEKLTKELEDQARLTSEVISMEIETSIAAEGFCQFIDDMDQMMTSQDYVASGQSYGTMTSSAKGTVGLISLLLGLLGVASLAWGYLHYVRGTMVGDSSADLAFMRIGIAMLAGVVVLNILATTFGFKSL
ncbi:MAG: hypothetical protein KBS72_03440 [Bacteroidales bacterium]|nr:hypothetical protein [Candidatus Cacconaster scatequi]